MASLIRGFHLIICLFALILAPSSSAVAAGDIFIGEYRLIVDDEPQPALERSAYGTATFAFSFVSEVGGVNFQNTTGNNAPIPSLSYDASRPDGRRLELLPV
jgi:hypothetical protein